MKSSLLCLILAAVLLITAAIPVDQNVHTAKILSQENSITPNGNYNYGYYLDDGTSQNVEGTLKEVDGNQVYRVEGSYEYSLPDGSKYRVTYTADENGFHIVSVKKFQIAAFINPKAVASLLG